MTLLLDRTRRAGHGDVGATVGSSSRQGLRMAGRERTARTGLGIAIGYQGAGLNPSRFAAVPQ
jgi:hypothetical protein